VKKDLETDQLRQTMNAFLRTYGNDSNARLFIYYAGHGYTEVIRQYNENRGYITGIDTPALNGTAQAYDAARLKAISMGEIRAPLEDTLAKSILFMFDSCFAGTIFTDRAGSDSPQPLFPEVVAGLMVKPARDFITAGRSYQRVPAHSPIPELFLAALNGAADPYRQGVISSVDIYTYLLNRVLQIRDINLTPQVGRLPNPAFAEGTFLFRVINPAILAPNQNETIRLYRADAAKGNATAQTNLAWSYKNGLGGLPKDDREAARLFKLAADQGNQYAQANLGDLYREGLGGLPKDDREAARLYKLAADQGNAIAQVNLGNFYAHFGSFSEQGRGAQPQDVREAARLFKLAADQGNDFAQTNLGLFYEYGRGGLAKDYREAARLYKAAADRGNDFARAALNRLKP
jgi:TPR repeat protein